MKKIINIKKKIPSFKSTIEINGDKSISIRCFFSLLKQLVNQKFIIF